jgi:transposase
MDHDHEHASAWARTMSIAPKLAVRAALNERVKGAEVDTGKRAGAPTDIAAKLMTSRREKA